MIISIICSDPLNLNTVDYAFINKVFNLGVVEAGKYHLILKSDDIFDITDESKIISVSVKNIWDYVAVMIPDVA